MKEERKGEDGEDGHPQAWERSLEQPSPHSPQKEPILLTEF